MTSTVDLLVLSSPALPLRVCACLHLHLPRGRAGQCACERRAWKTPRPMPTVAAADELQGRLGRRTRPAAQPPPPAA